jgi:peptidoglycan/LPS O-acetylase OafA/YrhL
MNIANPAFVVVLTLLAFLSVRVTFLFDNKNPPTLRFATINGLRGYLAFFVMLHHAGMWYMWVGTGKWVSPESNLYGNLGQSSVIMFFMITSFLFYDKLLNSRACDFNWRSFFIARFFRIAPLYYVVLLFIFLVVAHLSDWRLVDSSQAILLSVIKWVLFTTPNAVAINGVGETSLIVAGVTWTLRYEWFFYLALPLISLLAGQRPSLLILVVSVAALALAWRIGLDKRYVPVFAGGIIAACLVRNPDFLRFCKKKVASLLVLICFAVVLQFSSALKIIPCIALIIAFCMIAGGADIFGLLSLQTSHRFGELAYGIYLIHGIVLFTAINLLVGREVTASMSVPIYWSFVGLLALVTLAVAGMAYHYVERPGIDLGKQFQRRGTRLPVPSKA